MSKEAKVDVITENLRDDEEIKSRDMSTVEIPKGVEVFEVYGSLFFGAVSQFKESIRIVADRPQVVILRMRQVSHIDASGIHILEELVNESHAGGTAVVFSAVRPQVQEVMRDSGFVDMVGGDNFADDIFAALEIAKRHLGHTVTAGKQIGSEVK
jgi:SulP family sulfate permease